MLKKDFSPKLYNFLEKYHCQVTYAKKIPSLTSLLVKKLDVCFQTRGFDKKNGRQFSINTARINYQGKTSRLAEVIAPLQVALLDIPSSPPPLRVHKHN